MQEIVVKNPATLEIIQTLPVPDNSQINLMIESSQQAFILWKNIPLSQRRYALLKIAESLEAAKEVLARLLTTEQGKPLHESIREIDAIASVFRLYSTMSIETEIVRDDENAKITVGQEPYGVCALILPWNYPVGLLGWKLAPCLLAGNSAIVKPSQYAPLAVMKCIEIMSEFIPKNLVQVIPGGDEIGQYIVSQSGISRISFTGSQGTGRKIMQSAADGFPKITLEMGGNDAAIILPDCDLEKRFESIFLGCFFNAGQICVAIKRIYVHESLAPELISRFKDKAEALKVGNGLEPGIQMGPINNEPQLLKIEDLVEDARKAGAKIVCGGERTSGPGFFFQPTVVTDLDDSFALVKEEQFGPVIPILTYLEIDDVIARANGTGYGLGGSIWTEDIVIGEKLAQKLECGTVWLNAHMIVEHSAPFGGWKQSGMGRELGDAGLKEFLQYRTAFHKS